MAKLSQFTDRDTCGFSDNYLNYVNKLRGFWHEGKNAVVIDNQVRLHGNTGLWAKYNLSQFNVCYLVFIYCIIFHSLVF